MSRHWVSSLNKGRNSRTKLYSQAWNLPARNLRESPAANPNFIIMLGKVNSKDTELVINTAYFCDPQHPALASVKMCHYPGGPCCRSYGPLQPI